ncbi:hypothetical protein FSP39_000659, partial [Pinctada imbricata]
NPCRNGRNQVYYPVANDNAKFIQCDSTGEMYVVQCPAGKVYNQATRSCVSQVYNPNPPQTITGLGTNPCTTANLALNNIYFAVMSDNHKFIECDPNGNANVLTCPSLLVWDQGRLSCVYTFVAGQPQPTPNSALLPSTGVSTNPCRTALGGQNQFYPHPNPNKFIQCDLAGDAYVLTCPAGLVWSTYSNTCVSTITAVTG